MPPHILELIEPSEQTLNLPALLVPAQDTVFLSSSSYTIAFMGRNHFNALLGELLIERITVIGKIPNKSFKSSQGEGFIERSLDKGDFMRASRRYVHGE